MIQLRRLIAILALSCSPTLLAAPGPDAWHPPKAENGALALSNEQGILAIHYRLLPTVPHLFGNRTRLANDLDLLLRTPLPLAPSTERLTFEAKGLIPDDKSVANAVVIQPIVRDENGELFYFLPRDTANLSPSSAGWNAYSTAGFFSGEAGAATHSIYSTGGVPGNSRPDGKLELLGLRFHVTQAISAEDLERGRKVEKPVAGVLYLGDLREEPFELPFAFPYAYADSVLKTAGEYTFAVQITETFQGTPIREFRQTIAFAPDDPASCRQKLKFPLGPDGHYWIDYLVTAASGVPVVSDFMKHQVLGNPDPSPTMPVAVTEPPAIGYLRLNPGDPRGGVYAAGDPLNVVVRVFPQGKRNLRLRHTLRPYFQTDELAAGDQELVFTNDHYQDIALAFADRAPYTAYRLELELLADGKQIDQRTYVIGRQLDRLQQHPRAGQLTDRRTLKKAPYNRFTYTRLDGNRAGLNTNQALAADFRSYLENTHAFTLHHTYMMELNDFEVLPGVFDFSRLDDVMDTAADYGCKITVRFAHADKHAGPYRWGKFSRQISAEGTVIGMGSYGAYSVTDPNHVKLWTDAYRALYDRYRQHTAFEGYYIMKPSGEWTVVDQPWAGTVAGYSPITAQGFRDYLRKRLGLTLDALNTRWGSAYDSFDEIQPPKPTFRDGAVPDLRVAWLDFCRFKDSLNATFWVPEAIESIRRYDDDRVTIVYGFPSEFPHLYGKLDYGHNGGNHRLDHLGEFEQAWREGGIGWITEPIHPHGWAAQNDPGRDGWVLDVSAWTMLSQAGAGGANLHVYYYPNPSHDLVQHQGGFYALDRFERYKPILRELQQAKLVAQRAETAVNQDKETLFAKHRTTFSARLADLRQWFSLLEDDGIPYADLSAFPDTKFKLIVPNLIDEVIPLASLERYVESVKEDGARLVMGANTGKYVGELGKEPFQLLKALGITAPISNYLTQGTITAQATVESPLFAEGSTIPFQTVATMREQLASKDVIENFWQYPYRWIPETDYFGYYPGHQPGGTVLATFPDGGAAVSLHQVGKGEVLVFWGTPDISRHKLKGMMKRIADWASVHNPLAKAEVPHFTEMTNAELGRHYGLCYLEETFGTFRVIFPNCPDGDYFCDDMVADTKLRRISGQELRQTGLALAWQLGDSPLKIVRAIPAAKVPKAWVDAYNPN